MNKILETIGCIVLGCVIVIVPILLPISFIYNWYDGIKLLLILLTLGVWYFICMALLNIERR